MRVIGDKKLLKEFFDELMQPLKKDEVYIMFMVARKKWDTTETLTRNEEMLDIKILRDYDFDKFYRLLRRWEIPEDAYVDRNTGRPIPPVAKGYYIDLTPKSVAKGLMKYMKEFMEDLYEVQNDENRWYRIKKWYRFAMGNIHKSNARRKSYLIIDIDDKETETILDVVKLLRENEIPIKWISETHGGYHIFIERGEWMQKFYKEVEVKLRGSENIEIMNHCQTPIVGTFQGGFIVRRLML